MWVYLTMACFLKTKFVRIFKVLYTKIAKYFSAHRKFVFVYKKEFFESLLYVIVGFTVNSSFESIEFNSVLKDKFEK